MHHTAMRAFSSLWFVFAMALAIITAQLAPKPDRPIYADELQYLAVSMNVAEHGVFSDKPFAITETPAPTAFFAPVAPALYALLLDADADLKASISCQLTHPEEAVQKCRIAYGSLMRLVMGGLAALGLWGSWILARSLGFSAAGAWVTLVIVATSGSHAYFARHFLTEAPLLAVFPFFLALLARATAADGRRMEWIALGLAMGLLALIRPSYVYQAYAVIAALPLLRQFRGAGGNGPAAAGWTALGYAFTVLPWMLRNHMAVGQFALTAGYDHYILIQRMIYNQMSWAEWGMAWIYWLPDFGDSLAARLFGIDAVRKLSLVEPSGYHGAGQPPVPNHLATQPDGSPVTLGYLLQVLAGEPLKHMLVSLVMAWQGLWAGKYITFAAVLLAPLALPMMARTGRLRGFLVIASPVLFMVGFNAFVSVSIPRYNLPMLWISALVAAALAEAGLRRLKKESSP
jgi:hypothetical protein